MGMVLGFVLMILTTWIVHKKPLQSVNLWSKRMQFVSAALYSLGHGGNDAQKTMGIIASLMFTIRSYEATFHIPLWIVFPPIRPSPWERFRAAGGSSRPWARRSSKLKPIDGFCAETASADLDLSRRPIWASRLDDATSSPAPWPASGDGQKRRRGQMAGDDQDRLGLDSDDPRFSSAFDRFLVDYIADPFVVLNSA